MDTIGHIHRNMFHLVRKKNIGNNIWNHSPKEIFIMHFSPRILFARTSIPVFFYSFNTGPFHTIIAQKYVWYLRLFWQFSHSNFQIKKGTFEIFIFFMLNKCNKLILKAFQTSFLPMRFLCENYLNNLRYHSVLEPRWHGIALQVVDVICCFSD